MEQQQAKVQESHRWLEMEQRQRQFVLESMSDNLQDKRGQLQRELCEFQEQFERGAKAYRERVLGEQGRATAAAAATAMGATAPALPSLGLMGRRPSRR